MQFTVQQAPDVRPIFAIGTKHPNALIYNNGNLTVYLQSDSSAPVIGTSYPLFPGGSIIWDAELPLYVTCFNGVGSVAVLLNGGAVDNPVPPYTGDVLLTPNGSEQVSDNGGTSQVYDVAPYTYVMFDMTIVVLNFLASIQYYNSYDPIKRTPVIPISPPEAFTASPIGNNKMRYISRVKGPYVQLKNTPNSGGTPITLSVLGTKNAQMPAGLFDSFWRGTTSVWNGTEPLQLPAFAGKGLLTVQATGGTITQLVINDQNSQVVARLIGTGDPAVAAGTAQKYNIDLPLGGGFFTFTEAGTRTGTFATFVPDTPYSGG